MRAFALLAIIAASTACSRETKPAPSSKIDDVDANAPIGVAKMEPDGTIVMDLTARTGTAVGHGRLTYPPSHADYKKILDHLGGLRPGESKPVPPFPDSR